MLSDGVGKLTDSIIENMMLPFFNKGMFDTDFDNNNVPDQKQLENLKVNIFNTSLSIGKVIISTIKFISLSYVIYLLVLVSTKIGN